MVNVFCEQITPRLEYSFKLIFETILNDQVQFYDQPSSFNQAEGVKINYSKLADVEGLFLRPTKLLFEGHLQVQYPEFIDWEGVPAFFSSESSFIPFDCFAASFYLVTRYEEYLPSKRDRHKRYQVKSSLAATKGFLEKPLVNIWAQKMARKIEELTPGYQFKASSFQYLPTIDIDNAWAFRNKGLPRNLASSFRDLVNGRWGLFRKRWAVWFHIEKDPYDNYDFILDTINGNGFSPVFFFLINRIGKHDRSLSFRNGAYRSLIRGMASKGKVGIHPSYATYKNYRMMKTEVDRLGKILGEPITCSRQHYLRLSFPDTYQNLIKCGIFDDYTMGYPSRPGFRASICTPYHFFDLSENTRTNLTVHPFMVMDVTLRDYRNMRCTEAIQKIKKIMEETKAVGGTFVSLWHNESLSDHGHWQGWREVYLVMTRMARGLYNTQG